jgi:penicillin-insensitive murein endopeptidase
MVPLKNAVRFPTKPRNWFGYSVEFDEHGAMIDDGMGSAFGEIDFHAMAEHLLELQKQAEKVGGGIKRVFLAEDLLDELFAAPNGHLVQATIKIGIEDNQESADEHYHVDFDFPCQEL